jgi:DNA transformation protein
MRPEFRQYLLELFAPFGPVRIKPMFGGAGLYSGALFFGLIADERIYLKASEATKSDFEAEGKTHFTFRMKTGEIAAMSYYEIPDRLYDDPEELALWARKACDVAAAAQAAKLRPASRGRAKTRPRNPRASARNA